MVDEIRPGQVIRWFLGILLLVVVVGLALDWVFAGENFILYKFWAPKRAEVEREVFTNTPSYVLGNVQELENLQVEYLKADKNHQQALASIILHRAGTIPEDKMPQALREFIQKLKNERTGGAVGNQFE